MKKLIVGLVCLLVVSVNLYADKGDLFAPDSKGNFRIQSDDGIHATTVTIRANLKVSSEVYISGSNGLKVDNGILAKCDSWDNLPAKSSVCIVSVTISTNTLDGKTSAYAQGYVTQPANVPRNIGVMFDNGTDGDLACNITITGKDARGNTISEVIVATTNAMTYGNYAFSRVTGFTIGAALTGSVGSAETLRFNIGDSDKIGLLGDIRTSDDFYKAVVQTATTCVDETSSVTISATYDTWTHSDVPDAADDYWIFYVPMKR